MNTIQKKIALALAVTVGMNISAMADEKGHRVCDPTATIEIGQQGKLNEDALQKQIDTVKDKMQRVRHARGSHLLRKEEMRRHLQAMQTAMTELHNQMYEEGCHGAIHGALVETRVEVVEKRLGMLEQMVSQLVDHLSEEQEDGTSK